MSEVGALVLVYRNVGKVPVFLVVIQAVTEESLAGDSAQDDDPAEDSTETADPLPDDTPEITPDPEETVEALPDEIPDPALDPDMVPDTPGDESGDECEQQIRDLADILRGLFTSTVWTVTVRLDHNTFNPIGYAVIGGMPGEVSEEDARTAANEDTTFGGGAMLNPEDPDGAYVFYSAPGDFGGVSTVDALTGKAVFGGSIIWMGTGEINYPTEWRGADEMDLGCPSETLLGGTNHYDLVGGTEMSAAEAAAAIDALKNTAFPAAMARVEGMYSNRVVVIRYPCRVGAFDPSTAEWIILLKGHMLL